MNLANPDKPLHDTLGAMLGRIPPFPMYGVYQSSELPDDRFRELQDWASEHAVPYWATGLSMIHAADMIVASAVKNTNIPPRQD